MVQSGGTKKKKAIDFRVRLWSLLGIPAVRLSSSGLRNRNLSLERENNYQQMPPTHRSRRDVCSGGSQVALLLTRLHIAIALPTQSIAVLKDKSLPATKRNLTLDQLVIQAKHYSAAVRKGYLLFTRRE